MSGPDLEKWVTHLRAVARPAARDEPLSLGELEAPFRAAACGVAAAPRPEATPAAEIALWWALVDERIDVAPVLDPADSGPLLPRDTYRDLDVWTVAELCALHALSRLVRERRNDDWSRRVAAARDWHVDRTQPDNATNRPWALHVFLLHGTPESVHYAETLLHNCQVGGGPDALAAWILLDSAREIEAS